MRVPSASKFSVDVVVYVLLSDDGLMEAFLEAVFLELAEECVV